MRLKCHEPWITGPQPGVIELIIPCHLVFWSNRLGYNLCAPCCHFSPQWTGGHRVASLSVSIYKHWVQADGKITSSHIFNVAENQAAPFLRPVWAIKTVDCTRMQHAAVYNHLFSFCLFIKWPAKVPNRNLLIQFIFLYVSFHLHLSLRRKAVPSNIVSDAGQKGRQQLCDIGIWSESWCWSYESARGIYYLAPF